MNEKPPKEYCKTYFYRIHIKRGKKWIDAGDIYEEHTLKFCRKEFVSVNFYGETARIVKYENIWKLKGVVVERSFR